MSIASLNNKVVVVLGGTSGIGLAVAQAAALGGAKVRVASRDPSRVAAAVKALPPGAEGVALDLSDGAAVAAFFAGQGALDHLVYTAGESLSLAPLAETDLATARRAFELRYWGAFAAAQAAAPRLRPGGSIVFTSGSAGARPRPTWAVAASICTAVEGLTRALALELAPIRVNAVAPGVVRTPLWRGMTDEAREALYADQATRLPVGHVGEADEIAEAYLYLMRQTYVTGQLLSVDGGGLLV